MAGEKAVQDGFGRSVQLLAVFLYTYYGLLAWHRLAWLQAALDFMTVIFDSVGLQTNLDKTVGIVFQP